MSWVKSTKRREEIALLGLQASHFFCKQTRLLKDILDILIPQSCSVSFLNETIVEATVSCIAPSTFFNLLGDYGKTSINQFYDLMKNLQLYGITCMNYEIATKRTKDVKDTKVKLYVPWDMAAHVTNLHLVKIPKADMGA